MDSINKLQQVLVERTPIIVIGAGFSRGLKNKKGEEVLVGRDLAQILYNKILCEKVSEVNEEVRSDNLKEVVNEISVMGLDTERNKFLTERFRNIVIPENDYHMLLKKYKWSQIFTFNIDDAIENIYFPQEISVVNYRNTKQPKSTPVLYKMHGSVKEPEYEYVFNDSEYRDCIKKISFCNYALSVDYFRNDFIFLGTEFQEEDVQIMLEDLKEKVESNGSFNYFFITPNLKNRALKKYIEQRTNYHLIPWDTKTFLTFLDKNIIAVGQARRKLKFWGATFIDEEIKKIENITDVGAIYQGARPSYSDFVNGWIIEYPEYSRWRKNFNGEEEKNFITIYGDNFSGKTCVAMRFMYDYNSQGYVSIDFPLRSDIDIVVYKQVLFEYLKTLPKGAKVALLIENASFYYENLLHLINEKPDNLSKFIIITTASLNDFYSRKYVLTSNVFRCPVSYKIDKKYAENIYYKLSEKNHLGKLYLYEDPRNPKDSICKYLMHINDIIEALYLSQEGRKFSDYFSQHIDLYKGTSNFETFKLLCLFSKLNINNINNAIFAELADCCHIQLDLKKFIADYGAFLKVDDVGNISIRCYRVIKDLECLNFDSLMRKNCIKNIATYYATLIQDREKSPRAEIFQKTIKTKQLIEQGILGKDEVLQMLVEIENIAKPLSYYWIQRGIANRNLTLFEEANNSFEVAANIRDHKSYHIQHAQAKNYMEWGVWAVKNNKAYDEMYFEKGKEILSTLATSGNLYFGYTIHTYTDMHLKYYNLKKMQIPKDALQFIENGLKMIIDRDNYSRPIIKKFNDYCKAKNIDIVVVDGAVKSGSYIEDIDDIVL